MALMKVARFKPPNRLRIEDGWSVRAIDYHEAKAVILAFHYAKTTANTAVACFGLFSPSNELVGASMWMPPLPPAARRAAAGTTASQREVLVLSRLAIAPGIPTNAASFLLSHSAKLLDRVRWPVLLTYADAERHLGGIYKAVGWEELGRTKSRKWVNERGEQRGEKRASTNLSREEMRAQGFRMVVSDRIAFRHVAPSARFGPDW